MPEMWGVRYSYVVYRETDGERLEQIYASPTKRLDLFDSKGKAVKYVKTYFDQSGRWTERGADLLCRFETHGIRWNRPPGSLARVEHIYLVYRSAVSDYL